MDSPKKPDDQELMRRQVEAFEKMASNISTIANIVLIWFILSVAAGLVIGIASVLNSAR